MRPDRALAALDRGLKVSPQRRLELIKEIGADAEALQEELERRGHRKSVARRSALARVLPSSGALAQLEAQHAPRLGRWVRAAGLGGGLERVGATAAAALAGASLLTILWRQNPGAASTLLAWAQVVVVALLSSNWIRTAKRLWIDGILEPEARRVLRARQVGLIAAAVSLGGFGAAWEGYVALGALDASSIAGWSVLGRATYLAAIGLGTAVIGLFGWLILMPRLLADAKCERRIAAFLGRSVRPVGVSPRTTRRP